MFENLTERDGKFLRYGAIAAGVILAHSFIVSPFLDSWSQIRDDIRTQRQKIATLAGKNDPQSELQKAALFSIVPVVVSPESENLHRIHFQKRIYTQVSSVGVRVKSVQFITGDKYRPDVGFKQQKLQVRGTCNFGQLLDLLAILYQNPLLVGIDDLQITADQKNPQDMELVLTVSTFVK
jgi:hypothetical protein